MTPADFSAARSSYPWTSSVVNTLQHLWGTCGRPQPPSTSTTTGTWDPCPDLDDDAPVEFNGGMASIRALVGVTHIGQGSCVTAYDDPASDWGEYRLRGMEEAWNWCQEYAFEDFCNYSPTPTPSTSNPE